MLGIILKSLKLLGCLLGPPIGKGLVVLGIQERITEMIKCVDAIIFLSRDLATLDALITLTS